ncbi:MAG TPA: hypothetical protein VFH77_05940, partial [Streptomyces sp.]|nr:hypothetical protein [Streptomyces sp.]
VSLPETMKRSMARQAEAQRDRRARVINADAELEASKKLAQAAQAMSQTPTALQLRLLQTITSVATEKNSTLVLPFPVELLRFLDRGNRGAGAPDAEAGEEARADEEPEAVEPPESAPPELGDLAADALPPELAVEPRLSVEEAVEEDGAPRGPAKDT